MTNTQLSRIEMVVLATLSQDKPYGPKRRQEIVADYWDAADANSVRGRAEAELLRKSFASLGRRDALRITEIGSRALRTAFALERTPTWQDVKRTHLPALATGMAPTGGPRIKKSAIIKATADALGHAKVAKLSDLCDLAIAELLGMPPGLHKIGAIRAFALAKLGKVDPHADSEVVAASIASRTLDLRDQRGAFTKAAIRAWIRAENTPPPAPPPLPTNGKLVATVRDTLREIDGKGRFGSEKVFVSAIWSRLRAKYNVGDFSYPAFKRWLLDANRKQQLTLARADIPSAMDRTLVAESEIADLGATFHFVIDAAASNGRPSHAR